MTRRERLIEVLGLGPRWLPREGWFADHPAMPVHADSDEFIEPIEPVAEPQVYIAESPAPELAQPVSPAASPMPVQASTASDALPDWQTLQDTVAACRACRLCETRTQTVFGRGNPKARLMIIGEAPGENEDLQGEPFVGRAGALLDTMLSAAGFDRDTDVYIANVIKCRPPSNRNPSGEEIAACAHFLDSQIAHVQPGLILAMGRFAAHTLLESEASIQALRGKVHNYRGTPLIVSYHPAYLLRNQPDKAKAWSDLVLLRKTLAH